MDNLHEIYEKFLKDVGKHRAGGWGFKCKKCGCAVYSSEAYFPCQDAFIPVKIICQECGAKFKLAIVPDDIEANQKH